MLILTIIFGLFAIVNPFAAMPVFVSLTQRDDRSWRRLMALRASITMFAILAIFFFIGSYLLHFFGISIQGIKVAGGLIILKAGYDLYNQHGKSEISLSSNPKKDISFSPIAMPLLSGPGSIAFVIGLSSDMDNFTNYIIAIVSIIVVSVATFLILASSRLIIKVIGESGLEKMSRIAGFITMAVGIQMILTGVKDFF